MTENLLQKLEGKIFALVSEIESLRKQVNILSDENRAMLIEKQAHASKISEVIALLDTVVGEDESISSINTTKPVALVHA